MIGKKNQPSDSVKLSPFISMSVGIVLIFLFIFGLAPLLSNQEILNFIQEKEIDATPLFYTESEETGRIEFERKKKNARKKIQ